MLRRLNDAKFLKSLFVGAIVLISFYNSAAIGTLKIVLQDIIDLDFHSTSMFVNILNAANVLSIVLVLFLPTLMKRLGAINAFCAAFFIVSLFLLGVFFAFSSIFLYVFTVVVVGVSNSSSTLVHTLTQGNIGDKYRSTFQGMMSVGGGAIFVVLPFAAEEFGHNRFTYVFFALGLVPLIFFIKWLVRGNEAQYEAVTAPSDTQDSVKGAAKRLSFSQSSQNLLANSHYLLQKPEVVLLTLLASVNVVFFRFLVFLGDSLHFTHFHVTEFQSIVSLGGMLLVLPLSWVSDKVGHIKMFAVYLMLIIGAHSIVLWMPDTFINISVLYFCIAGLSDMLYVLSISYLAKTFKREELGRAYASRAIIIVLFSIAFNYAFGYVLTQTGASGLSIGMIVLDVVGLAFIIRLNKRQNKVNSLKIGR